MKIIKIISIFGVILLMLSFLTLTAEAKKEIKNYNNYSPENKNCNLNRPNLANTLATHKLGIFKSYSMMPCIDPNIYTQIEVATNNHPSQYYNLKINDVVVFNTALHCVDLKCNKVSEKAIHRIVSKTKNGYITKGDNNKYADLLWLGYLTPENYGGLVVGMK